MEEIMTDQQRKAAEEAAQAYRKKWGELSSLRYKSGMDEVISNPEKYGLVDRAVHNNLSKRFSNMVAFYDKHVGTPCEEIRHQAEVEELKEENARLREALQIAHASLCTYGKHPLIDEQVRKALKGGDL